MCKDGDDRMIDPQPHLDWTAPSQQPSDEQVRAWQPMMNMDKPTTWFQQWSACSVATVVCDLYQHVDEFSDADLERAIVLGTVAAEEKARRELKAEKEQERQKRKTVKTAARESRNPEKEAAQNDYSLGIH